MHSRCFSMSDMAAQTVPFSVPLSKIELLQANVERVIRGKSDVVRLAVSALLARGHVLLEDVPGVGKTTLARSQPGGSTSKDSTERSCLY